MSGSFQVVEIIETFVNYMENLERCICIVYDSTAVHTGSLGLKAIRLGDTFVEAYREGAWVPRQAGLRCACVPAALAPCSSPTLASSVGRLLLGH